MTLTQIDVLAAATALAPASEQPLVVSECEPASFGGPVFFALAPARSETSPPEGHAPGVTVFSPVLIAVLWVHLLEGSIPYARCRMPSAIIPFADAVVVPGWRPIAGITATGVFLLGG